MLKDRKLAAGRSTALVAQWTNTVFALYSTGRGFNSWFALNFFRHFFKSFFLSLFCNLGFGLPLVLALRLVLGLR